MHEILSYLFENLMRPIIIVVFIVVSIIIFAPSRVEYDIVKNGEIYMVYRRKRVGHKTHCMGWFHSEEEAEHFIEKVKKGLTEEDF